MARSQRANVARNMLSTASICPCLLPVLFRPDTSSILSRACLGGVATSRETEGQRSREPAHLARTCCREIAAVSLSSRLPLMWRQ